MTRAALALMLVAVCVIACGKYGPPVRAEARAQAESDAAPDGEAPPATAEPEEERS